MYDDEGEETDDDQPIEVDVAYYSASGPSNGRCAFLAIRYDADTGYRPGDGESWICVNDYRDGGRGTLVTNGTAAWYTRLWSTLEGSVYVARHDGWVIRNRNIHAPDALSRWENDRIEGRILEGVFGIDDAAVFVWGHDPRARAGRPFPESDVFRWDGQRWSPMPGPGFQILAMHGTSATDLWVGGPRGAVARWDGGRWTQIQSRHDELINAIWAAAPDEVYATTTRGTILEGSASGMLPIATLPGAELQGDVSCVAKWKGELWVGSPRLGLHRRIGTTRDFEPVKPNIDCISMDARDELLLCGRNRIAGTPDGAKYKGFGADCVRDVRAPHPLGKNLG
jgi:hypothetical protein